ncbi:UNVERIFIED_CONTAM: Protein-tyrosine sulfotransferase [Sesamum calycinum]|uniref:Protein-tyrosine sulfotransferase n=1 Tax=Sesamum calycinum TaxID=2727403 RepID=A0AAW2SDQ8_9LAMI
MSTRFRYFVHVSLMFFGSRRGGNEVHDTLFKVGADFGAASIWLLVPVPIKALARNYMQCEYAVKKWASSSLVSEVKDDKHALRDLLFFLHIPRTGGRTYFYCFLKKLYSKSQECPRSYDKLRLDPRKPHCRLLSTHDDYSMISKLPNEKTSVVTILRDPIDRVFSTYEFSVEVAARFLVHPNLTSMARMAQHKRRKASVVSTLDVWPWKYLVPWMIEDLFGRRDARKLRGQSHLEANNPYDMEDILMPLREYINDSIAGYYPQWGHLPDFGGVTARSYLCDMIAGLTNYSYFAESHEVRHCVLRYQTLGGYVLEVAKARHQVPEAIIQEIASLNSLDMELYTYAKNIFKKQQEHAMRSVVGAFKAVNPLVIKLKIKVYFRIGWHRTG